VLVKLIGKGVVKRTMNTISNASHAQYVIIHFQPMSLSPMGFTNVVKNPAERPKSWKTVMPLARCAKGKSSMRYAVVTLVRPQYAPSLFQLTIRQCVVSNIITGLVYEDDRNGKPCGLNLCGFRILLNADGPHDVAY
jgi:hypothetical protein